jgi:hypothetical protein
MFYAQQNWFLKTPCARDTLLLRSGERVRHWYRYRGNQTQEKRTIDGQRKIASKSPVMPDQMIVYRSGARPTVRQSLDRLTSLGDKAYQNRRLRGTLAAEA